MSFWNQPYLQLAARVGSFGGKISAIAAAAFGIHKIWTNNSEQSWHSKALLSLLYSLHIGSISLTAAVLLGASDVSAPMATAIVCSTALLKSIGDLIVDKNNYVGLEQKHSSLQEALVAHNIDFHTNLTLIEDLKETDDAIDSLRSQLNEYHVLLRNTRNKANVLDVFQTIKDLNEEQQLKSITIQSYFSKIDLENFDVDGKIKVLQDNVSSLSDKLRNSDNGIILFQCIKYKRILSILNGINSELLLIGDNADETIKCYLMKRRMELEQRLRMLTTGTPLFFSAFSFLMKEKNTSALQKALQTYLKKEISIKEEEINEQLILLGEKKAYLCRPIDFSPFVKQIKGISATRNQLLVLKLSEISKAKSVDFGLVTAISALILVLMPNAQLSFVLNPLMLSIGVLSGAVSLSDLYKRYQTINRITDNEKRQFKQFIVQKKFQIARLSDEHLRKVLSEQLDNILNENETHVPVRSTEFVSNSPRSAKLVAKTMIFQQARVKRDGKAPEAKERIQMRPLRLK